MCMCVKCGTVSGRWLQFPRDYMFGLFLCDVFLSWKCGFLRRGIILGLRAGNAFGLRLISAASSSLTTRLRSSLQLKTKSTVIFSTRASDSHSD